jgi:hypothetical protein
VGGQYNQAGYKYQTVVGKYNKNEADSLFEVGNGASGARSNAIAVKDDGRIQKGASDAFAAASNLAPVEMTRTMAASHSAGSFLFVAADDQFYQVGSSTLSQGATLTPGTNATAKSVSDVLASLNSHLASMFLVESVALGANAVLPGLFDVTKNVAKTGYTAIGVVGHSLTRDSKHRYDGVFVSSSSIVHIEGYNENTSSSTVNGEVYVLYKKA